MNTPSPKQIEFDLYYKMRLRRAALIIAVGMVLWMGAQILGGWLNLPPHYVFIADFAALIALVWALFITYGIWKARRNKRSHA